MLSYEECKKIAVERASQHDLEITKAYHIGSDYVFADDNDDAPGFLPEVVRSENGECWGIWEYINHFNMTMDDMVEIPLDGK